MMKIITMTLIAVIMKLKKWFDNYYFLLPFVKLLFVVCTIVKTCGSQEVLISNF